eukprot:2216893-Rhodomonas_salina.2
MRRSCCPPCTHRHSAPSPRCCLRPGRPQLLPSHPQHCRIAGSEPAVTVDVCPILVGSIVFSHLLGETRVISWDDVSGSEGAVPQALPLRVRLPFTARPDTIGSVLLGNLNGSDVACGPAVGGGSKCLAWQDLVNAFPQGPEPSRASEIVGALPCNDGPPLLGGGSERVEQVVLLFRRERVQDDDRTVQPRDESFSERCAPQRRVQIVWGHEIVVLGVPRESCASPQRGGLSSECQVHGEGTGPSEGSRVLLEQGALTKDRCRHLGL